jgi:hypothetical protein
MYMSPVVHPDGTIFAVQADGADEFGIYRTASMIGIDPASGTKKFAVPLANYDNSSVWDSLDSGLIVAGDGYAYVAYTHADLGVDGGIDDWQMMLLRVNSAGESDSIQVKQFAPPPPGYQPHFVVNMITNADTGIVLCWEEDMQGELMHSGPEIRVSDGPPPPAFGMAVTAGAGVTLIDGPAVAGQVAGIVPGVQAQDGTFVGSVQVGDPYNPQTNMVAFDASGDLLWSVANEQPAVATEDGGVVGQSGATYDANGHATGQMSLPTYSWTGNASGWLC